MAPEEARRQALIGFGNVALITEDTQAVWGWPLLDAIGQDLRYVLRTLRRKPAFALVVVLTLGFGIGLNTATFSIVNAALIRPLGFADPERLVALHERFGVEDAPFSPSDFLDVERDQQSFADVAAFGNLSLELSDAPTRPGSMAPRSPRACSRCSASALCWAAISALRRTAPVRTWLC